MTVLQSDPQQKAARLSASRIGTIAILALGLAMTFGWVFLLVWLAMKLFG